jgi:hypothetical protein
MGVNTVAASAASAGSGSAGAGVAVILAVIAIWWLATHGKGTASGRLIAWLLLPAVAWVVLAARDPVQAGHIASGAASGAAAAVSGFSRLVSSL